MDLGTDLSLEKYKSVQNVTINEISRPAKTRGSVVDIVTSGNKQTLPGGMSETKIGSEGGLTDLIPDYRNVIDTTDRANYNGSIKRNRTTPLTDNNEIVYENLPDGILNRAYVPKALSVPSVHPVSNQTEYERKDNLIAKELSAKTRIQSDQSYNHIVSEPELNYGYSKSIHNKRNNDKYNLPAELDYLNDQGNFDVSYKRALPGDRFQNSRHDHLSHSSSALLRNNHRSTEIPASEPQLNSYYKAATKPYYPAEIQYLKDQEYFDNKYGRNRSRERNLNPGRVHVNRSSSAVERNTHRSAEKVPNKLGRGRYFLPQPPSHNAHDYQAPAYRPVTSFSMHTLPRDYRHERVVNGQYSNSNDRMFLSQRDMQGRYGEELEHGAIPEQYFWSSNEWPMIQSYPDIYRYQDKSGSLPIQSRHRYRSRSMVQTKSRDSRIKKDRYLPKKSHIDPEAFNQMHSPQQLKNSIKMKDKRRGKYIDRNPGNLYGNEESRHVSIKMRMIN